MLPAPRLPLLVFFALFPAAGWAAPFCATGPVINLPLGNCSIRVDGQSDVHSSGFRVDIDGADSLCVSPSTVVPTTFIMTANICNNSQLTNLANLKLSPQQCRSRRGGFITEQQARDLPTASIEGLSDANPNWGILDNVITGAASVTLRLLGDGASMVVGFISAGQKSTASHLGLAKGSVVLQALKEQGLIAARSFGFDAGSQSIQFPRPGSLILGGYDRASYAASSYKEFPVSDGVVGKRHCPLQVRVTEINMTGTTIDPNTGKENTTTSTILTRSSNTDFCVEPYDTLFRVPSIQPVKDWFNAVTGWTNASATPEQYSHNVIDLEPGLVFTSKAPSFDGSMTLLVNGTMIVEIPLYELWRPLRGLDADGEYELDTDYNELQIYAAEGDGSAAVLGKAFLSQVYLFVDYEADPPIFRLTPRSDAPTSTGAVSSAPCAAEGLRPADKGLIGVGSVLGALILGLLGFAVYRYFPRASAGKGKGCKNSPPPELADDEGQQPPNQAPQVVKGDGLGGAEGTTGTSVVKEEPVAPPKKPKVNYR